MKSRIKSHIIEDMRHMDVSVYLRNVLKHNKVTTLEELGAMSYTDLKIIMPKRIVIEAIGLLNKHYIF
jgi:hypothetical protein